MCNEKGGSNVGEVRVRKPTEITVKMSIPLSTDASEQQMELQFVGEELQGLLKQGQFPVRCAEVISVNIA